MRSEMQIIFQDPFSSLNPRMTVFDIVSEPMVINGEKNKDVLRSRVRELLEMVGLKAQHMNRYPYAFSGGQRQRLGIARALALQPKIIVADEPVSALDVSIQAQVINLLEDLQAEFGLTYVFIAHDLSVVEHISDRVAVMYLGSIVELTEARTLYRQALHPYTEALLSAVPRTDPDQKKQRIILQGDVPSPSDPPPGCTFHPRCRYAKEICSQEEPALVELKDGHFASCHFAEELALAGLSRLDPLQSNQRRPPMPRAWPGPARRRGDQREGGEDRGEFVSLRYPCILRIMQIVYTYVYTFKEEPMQTTTAKVFISGNSQAIRLPKEFRLDANEVFIQRSGDSLILTPRMDSWDGFVEGFSGFSDDFDVTSELPADLPRKAFE